MCFKQHFSAKRTCCEKLEKWNALFKLLPTLWTPGKTACLSSQYSMTKNRADHKNTEKELHCLCLFLAFQVISATTTALITCHGLAIELSQIRTGEYSVIA